MNAARVVLWVRERLGIASRAALPPGVDEVRLLEGPEAAQLAELAALRAATEQAVVALRTLADRRRHSTAASEDPAEIVTDLALLRLGVVQFVACFGRQRGSGRLTARQAFDEDGARFLSHLKTLGEELEGAHARMVGETEAVVLLRRHGDRLAAATVVTRTRRPDRLTTLELAQLIAFMERGVEAYGRLWSDRRGALAQEVQAWEPDQLEDLPMGEV